ncbi:MAG: 2-dehydropantoate 2-reductase [Desulfobacteraceae bacterium]|nr:2-dehydropantoate 2-reductase [Desulfobacteraceae bacterium]
MKIAVVGAGAMGSLFAGYLAQKFKEVWVYDIWQEHIATIKNDGLLMTRGNIKNRVRIKATTNPDDPGKVDLLIIFVKYTHTEKALKDSLAMIDSHTSILTLQNGIGNVDIIQKFIPDNQILYGLTTLTSEMVGPGHIEESFHGQGETYFWPVKGRVDGQAEQICSVFNRADIHTEISPDVQVMVWKKLIVNACYNTLSAIVRLKVGDLIDQTEIWPVLEGAISEIVDVAQKKGISIDESEGQRFLKQVGEEAREHIPSMLIDVKNKKKTEIECLNGRIIKEGTALGIPTPYNRVLFGILRVLENTYEKRVD